jgi:hypothetical protein
MTWTEDDFLLLALLTGVVIGALGGWVARSVWR